MCEFAVNQVGRDQFHGMNRMEHECMVANRGVRMRVNSILNLAYIQTSHSHRLHSEFQIVHIHTDIGTIELYVEHICSTGCHKNSVEYFTCVFLESRRTKYVR